MGDRIRIGELLTAIGTVGLIVALVALDWLEATLRVEPPQPGSTFGPPLGGSARTLGWFAFAVLVITVIAAVVFLVRALTARSSERPMLQAPIAYVISGFAFLTLLVRMFIVPPGDSTFATPDEFPDATTPVRMIVEQSPTAGGYIGLLAVFLIVVGLWFAMHDQRTNSAAAKAQTAALLAASPARRVPVADSAPNSDASLVADDAIPFDPAAPGHRAAEGPA